MSDICEFCGSPLTGGPVKGRPRKYCGNACRQAAHRRRLHTGPTAPDRTTVHSAQPEPSVVSPPAVRAAPAARATGHVPTAGDELLAEIARDIQEGARDLTRLMPALGGEEPLRRVVQLQEQLDGLTAAVVGRARYRRVTWAAISSILGISEDTARHRYTERYVLRRLARFNRSETTLTSLARLFASPTASPHDPPPAGDTGSESSDAGGDRGDRGDGSEQQTAPIESSGAAYNRLSPILSMLIRTAQLTNKEVGSRIGCSASYMSRILSGERVPTWEITRKFAQACGADPAVLRTVWESEKLRQKTGTPATPQDDAPTPNAAEQLRTAIHTLHLRAGRPSPSDIAVASRWILTAEAVASLLEASVLPPHEVLQTFVRLLGGDPDHFSRLLDNAHHEATRDTALLQPPTPPPAPRPHRTPGPDAMIKTFSKALTEDHTVEDGRARLLHKLAEKTPTTNRHHHRTLATLTETLRQRRLLPPTTITPLKGT
ncbi:helix-turn-helix domain-containing protein [Streptomyces pilosus]|uniref:helix-turn-helix domain-containing protein n=1 Tax=Streptomyces pilosus TaxID=28893 RepID=UPI00364012FC